VNVSYEAKMPQMLHIAFFVASIVFTLPRTRWLVGHYLQAKNRGDALLLANPLGCVNSRKNESSLTVLDFCRATVMVRPSGCLVCSSARALFITVDPEIGATAPGAPASEGGMKMEGHGGMMQMDKH
jgi:hypothetical protein